MVLLIYGVRLPPLCQKPHINLLGRVTDQVFSESEEWDIDTVSETIASEYERATNLSINKEKQNLPIEEKRTIDVKEIREWLNFIITISNDKEEWIVVENAHEPIISDELFRKANEKAFTNQKKVLAKRGVACPIFFCPTCGRRLGFTSRETGYRCMQAHISGLSGCAESKMDRKEAEETVLDAARNMAQFISENLEKKKREWHKTILKEENIATLKSEKKRLSSRKMKLYSDYRSEVLDKEGYMEELEKTTSRILEITLQIAELENEIAVAKKKCDEATEKEMEVNEIAALQDFDKIQLSKIIEKVFIYEPGRMEISWKMDDIFYKEEKA